MIISALIVILFFLMSAVGGKRGKKAFLTLFINIFLFFIILKLMLVPINPILITIIGSISISSILLFYLNGFNKKTICAIISILIVILLTILITYHIGIDANIHGFSKEQLDAINSISWSIPVNFSQLVISIVILGLLGAINDVAVSISSSMNELYRNNPALNRKTLFVFGMNIGKDILGTMINTLFFAYISGFMMLFLYINKLNLTIGQLINKKIFISELYQILCSGIGIIIIIPVTSIITMYVLTYKKTKNVVS